MGNYNSPETNKKPKPNPSTSSRPINITQITSNYYRNYIEPKRPIIHQEIQKPQVIKAQNNVQKNQTKPKVETKIQPITTQIKTQKIVPKVSSTTEVHLNKTQINNVPKPKNNISNTTSQNKIIINNNNINNNKINNYDTKIKNQNKNQINNNYNNQNKQNDEYYYEDDGDYDQGEDYDEDYYEEEEYYEEEDNYYNNGYNNNISNRNQNQLTFDNKKSFTEMIDKTINPYPLKKIKDQEINVLMIAEKPSIARTIAKILGGNNLIDLTRQKGWCYYEFDGDFKGAYAHFIITAVSGHIYQADFPEDYQSYDIDPYDLFDAPVEKVESNEDSYLNIEWLEEISQGIDVLCLWLDCDREGENICYEIMYHVLPNMNKKEYQQVYRAIFSSLAEDDIIYSFDNLSNYPDNNLSLSVDARQIIDLKVGVSITRFLTNNIMEYLPEDVDTDCISYGPCQTPTLYFCVKREREMENEKNKYYKIYIKLKSKEDNSEIDICLDKEFDNFEEVENIMNQILGMKQLRIDNINSEKRTKSHPNGLNTATLLKISSLYLKNSPQKTMNLAQSLYMAGAITYPRTETTYYSSSFNFEANLISLGNEELIDYVYENLDAINENGFDAGDHPPITPLNYGYNITLNKNQEVLYNLICDYYLASLSPDMEYNSITYEFKIGNKIYKATSHVIENEGYLEYFNVELKDFDDDIILEKNKYYDIIKVDYEELIKDDYITEAELIEEMEKNRIGTDASMSVHIENIVKRGYVTVTQDRKLIPTDLGRALIEGLESVEPELVLPKNRAIIEDFVSQLAEGKKTYQEVLDHAINFYKAKYSKIYEGIDTIYEAFRNYFDLPDDYYY